VVGANFNLGNMGIELKDKGRLNEMIPKVK
jgi:hypothetical protein